MYRLIEQGFYAYLKVEMTANISKVVVRYRHANKTGIALPALPCTKPDGLRCRVLIKFSMTLNMLIYTSPMLIAMTYLYRPMGTMKYLWILWWLCIPMSYCIRSGTRPLPYCLHRFFSALYQSACNAPSLLASKAIDRDTEFCLFLHRGWYTDSTPPASPIKSRVQRLQQWYTGFIIDLILLSLPVLEADSWLHGW